jgi:hypothetical protein
LLIVSIIAMAIGAYRFPSIFHFFN